MSRNTPLANAARRSKRSPRGEKKPLAPITPASGAQPRTPIGAAIQRRYLTRTEAAGYLGFSIEKLIQLVKAQQIPEFEFGPFTRRYRLEDLEAFAQARRRQALEKAAETLLA
jgi:hypothetical protein